MVNFGNTLRLLRKRSGITQQQLADKVGVTKSVISYYELQERYPSPEMLIKLAKTFHVTTDYLLGMQSTQVVDVSGLDEADMELLHHLIAVLKSKHIDG